MSDWIRLAARGSVVRRATKYAVVAGVVLVAINQCDLIARGDITGASALKMVSTVRVPYLVSTFSSVGAMLEAARAGR